MTHDDFSLMLLQKLENVYKNEDLFMPFSPIVYSAVCLQQESDS